MLRKAALFVVIALMAVVASGCWALVNVGKENLPDPPAPWPPESLTEFVDDFAEGLDQLFSYSSGIKRTTNDPAPEEGVVARVYRNSADFAEEIVYRLDQDIAEFKVTVYWNGASEIATGYQIYLSSDGDQWEPVAFLVENRRARPGFSGWYWAELVPEQQLEQGYEYVKIELAQISPAYKNQVGIVRLYY